MRFILCLLVTCSVCLGIAFEDVDIDIYGNTNYSKDSSESFITTLNFEYQIKLFEPSHKKYMIYFGGKINPDYDHFNNEIKTNVFTTLGIDF